MASSKEKWISQGIEEGYLSAMAHVMTFTIVHQNNVPDELITEFDLKRKDFLKYLDVEDIEEIDKVIDNLPNKAKQIWLS